MRKSSGSQPSVISSIDPSIAPLVTGNSEFLDDYLNVSSLSSLEVSAWIGNNDAEGRTRDEIGRENLQYPVFYSTKVPGAIEWDTRSEIYFTSEAMPGMSTCLEHISLFFEASSSNFPDRTILDLVGKKLFLAVDSSVVTYEYDLNEKAFPTDRKRVPLPLEVTDIFLGDYKMDLEYPDKVGYRSPVAKLRNGERDGLYEFQFPDIKSLIALFNYRPYKRPSSFSPDL